MSMWELVEERDYNMIKKLPDLNTPIQIYNEWTQMEESVSLPVAELTEHFTSAPSLPQLQTYIIEACNCLAQIIAAKSDVSGLRAKVREVSQRVYNVTMFYSGMPETPVVMKEIRHGNSRVIQAMETLNQLSSNVFVVLGRLTVHTECLANPKFPLQGYWGILKILNERVQVHVLRYIEQMNTVIWNAIPQTEVLNEMLGPSESHSSIALPTATVHSHTTNLLRQLSEMKKAVKSLKKSLRPLQSEEDAALKGPAPMSEEHCGDLQLKVASIESLQDSEYEACTLFLSIDEASQARYLNVDADISFEKLREYAWGWFQAGKQDLLHGNQSQTKKALLLFVKQISKCLSAYKAAFSAPSTPPPGPTQSTPLSTTLFTVPYL